ncbi:unnamed protein product [Discosporangium mesarthrocarpum]
MTVGLAAGPYGDPDRAAVGPSMDGSVTREEAELIRVERPISLHRTSYSTVVRLTRKMPPEAGTLVWLSQYNPAVSSPFPMYIGAEEVPRPYSTGSLFRFNTKNAFWAFLAVGNHASRWYKYVMRDVKAVQDELERRWFDEQESFEQDIMASLGGASSSAALPYAVKDKLTERTNSSAFTVLETYQALFPVLLAKYHDSYVLKDNNADLVDFDEVFYPKWWLHAVDLGGAGSFSNSTNTSNEAKAAQARGDTDVTADEGFARVATIANGNSCGACPGSGLPPGRVVFLVLMLSLVSGTLGYLMGTCSNCRDERPTRFKASWAQPHGRVPTSCTALQGTGSKVDQSWTGYTSIS